MEYNAVDGCKCGLLRFLRNRAQTFLRLLCWHILFGTRKGNCPAFSEEELPLRNICCPKRGLMLIALLAVAAAAMMVSGCGNSATDTGATAAPTSAPAPHASASGQAIVDKVSFDQLTLESPAKTVKDKHGLVFLQFKYADSDGKVYECMLPMAQSKGQFTLSEWSSTFNAYRSPKVLAQKKVAHKEQLGDFPFISPKPQAQQQAEQQGQQGQQSGPGDAIPALPGPAAPSGGAAPPPP